MNIKETIQSIIRDELPVQVTVGKVVSVNESDMTCDVEIPGRAGRLDVRIRAVADGTDTGILIYPVIGSYVLVGLIDNKPASSFIAGYSEVDKIRITGLNLLELNGDSHGGLVISSEVADELNQIKHDINQLKQIFSTWTPVSQDGGAALKTAASTWYQTQLQDTNKNDLENQKVKHGE